MNIQQPDHDLLARLSQIIAEAKSLVFFGGAGVSTESGLPDFRSAAGLYQQKYPFPPEIMLSRSFFFSNPEAFFDFYKAKLLDLGARPNAAHNKLADLESAGRLAAVVTQNIDGLHQLAGSRKVLELHGSVHRNYCLKCHAFYDAAFIEKSVGVPFCPCGGMIKPDVVLYEESLDEAVMQESARLIRQADVLIIGGTSLAVYPAAGLIAHYRGRQLVLINKEANRLDDQADLVIHGPIGQIFSRIKV